MFRRYTLLFWSIFSTSIIAIGQVQPNCRDLNASIDPDGQILFTGSELISNPAGSIDTVTITFLDNFDQAVFGPVRVDVDDPLLFAACPYLNSTLKTLVSTPGGSCWSTVSFKLGHPPVVNGRVFDVYCFDSLIIAPDNSVPLVEVPCDLIPPDPVFVSDWVELRDCLPGVNDTAKIIYREWEAIDKEGRRGVGFDTIIVHRLPEITSANLYCAIKDTLYCGNPEDVRGPYITFPEDPADPMGLCDTLYLLDITNIDLDEKLEFSTIHLADLCELGLHLEYDFLKDECENQYLITLDIKQTCFGPFQPGCIVTPPVGTFPNVADSLSPGYWRCQFWLVDLDTLPPTLHCKDPLFTGEFDISNWVEQVDGDGSIDTSWAPYSIRLLGNDNSVSDLMTDLCLTVEKDTVLAFYWEYVSENMAAGYDPFGYRLNGEHYQLTEGTYNTGEGAVNQSGYRIVELRVGDEFCFSQQSSDGMFGRAITTIKPILIVPTSNNECAAHTYLPRLHITDDWSGVKTVKGAIEGIGTYLFSYDEDQKCYVSHTRIKLSHSQEAYKVIVEALDSCHNNIVDSCYILVKDNIRPVAVIDKHITVSLSDKKVWVNAEDFNEGSSDNCGVNLFLARRVDWYEACLDLCDSMEYVCVNEHEDTLWKSVLETDKNIDPVESHYAQQLKEWSHQEVPCANIIYNAWQYDLIKHAMMQCREHPYEITDDHIRDFIGECFEDLKDCFLPVAIHPDPYEIDPLAGQNDLRVEKRMLDFYQQIGGGWCDAVPFDCADACGPVKIEVLVMDYWCNWATAWTEVWVEDKTPAKVVQDVIDGDITCKTYKTARYTVDGYVHPLSIEQIVNLAKEEDAVALGALDEIFGGYQKVWKSPYGTFVDEFGEEVADTIPLSDSTCFCEVDSIRKVLLFDEHFGYYWKDDTTYHCGYDEDLRYFQQGMVEANCQDYVSCEQEVWCEIDHCGEGVIYRKWKIWQSCPDAFYASDQIPDSIKQKHIPDTIRRLQKIYIFNECELDRHMFDVPVEVEIEDCGFTLDPGTNNVGGAAHPDLTGWLTYQFDDDCRLVGIGYKDKVFSIVGGDGFCYKIIRTWYYMDWCEGIPDNDFWWQDNSLEIDSFLQTIWLTDTIAPICSIGGPVPDGGTIEVGACEYDLELDVLMMDACGISRYEWVLIDLKDDSEIDGGHALLEIEAQQVVPITIKDIAQGSYKLKIRVVDACNNEGECLYFFDVLQVKKPTPICISALTARLNPMDLDQNGEVDTGLVTIWAEEFDQSSSPACDDDEVELRIELIDDIDDDTWEEDGASIEIGCDHVGLQRVRLWLISQPSGTIDFCDVVLNVQADLGICVPDGSDPGSLSEYSNGQDYIDPNITKIGQDDKGVIFIPNRLKEDELALHQNQPNPFTDQTIIAFSLPSDMEAQLTLFDINGRQLRRYEGEFHKGKNEVLVHATQLNSAGVIYYRLTTQHQSFSRKMILLR